MMDAVNDVDFCEGHGEGSCFGFWVFIALSGWFVKVLRGIGITFVLISHTCICRSLPLPLQESGSRGCVK